MAKEQARADQLKSAQAETADLRAALQSAEKQRTTLHRQVETMAEQLLLARAQQKASMEGHRFAPQGPVQELGARTPEPQMALRRGPDGGEEVCPSDSRPGQVGGLRLVCG